VLFDNSVSFAFDWFYSYVKYGKENGLDKNITCEAVDQKSNMFIHDKNETRDIHTRLRSGSSHVPFLHMQAADIVQLKQETFHVNSHKWWSRCGLRTQHVNSDSEHEDIEDLSDISHCCDSDIEGNCQTEPNKGVTSECDSNDS